MKNIFCGFTIDTMFISADLGGSTIDVVSWDGSPGAADSSEIVVFPKILKVSSFERAGFFADKGANARIFFEKIASEFNFASGLPEKFLITGGKSCFFPDFYQKIPIIKIDEIKAIGRGGHFLLHNDLKLEKFRKKTRILVVSMGTGTCMVQMKQQDGIVFECRHVGGTGVGGGTFLGLSRALLGDLTIAQLRQKFESGDKNKVDLSVYDIIGKGIGLVPPEATAANLAKLDGLMGRVDFSENDLAAGIVNLIGQTIGLVAVFAAKASNCELVLLTGKLTMIQKIIETILGIGKIYDLPMAVPDQAAFVSALGAWSES